jgi:hypothetical protein
MKLPQEGSLMAVRDLWPSRRTGRPTACHDGQEVTMFEYDLSADDRNAASRIAKVTITAAEMQGARRVMVLGIDYWQFERFRRLTPAIVHYINGRQKWQPPRDYAPTADEFGFLRDFIVTAKLRVAEHQA